MESTEQVLAGTESTEQVLASTESTEQSMESVLASMESTEQVQDNSQSTETGNSNSSESRRRLKRTERPAVERSPTQTTKSPAYKKAARRSRSQTEFRGSQQQPQTRRSLFPASASSAIAELSYNHYSPLKSNHTIEEFHLTVPERNELKKLEEMAFLYIVHR